MTQLHSPHFRKLENIGQAAIASVGHSVWLTLARDDSTDGIERMCGRFTLRFGMQKLIERFDLFEGLEGMADLPPRYNIAPTQEIVMLRQRDEPDSSRFASLARWGLIPSWSREIPKSAPLINARSETIAEKPSFRTAFKSQRCLIPADGYYEWKEIAGQKQPYFIRRNDGEPFAFAGIWDRWRPRFAVDASELVTSCSIVTTTANLLMEQLHDRMPVILPADKWDEWLDSTTPPDSLQNLMIPAPPEEWNMATVSRMVNNARNEDPRCVIETG